MNRLTHECCVDSDPNAADVGLLTGAARRLHEVMEISKRESTAPVKSRETFAGLNDEYTAIDPSKWTEPQKKRAAPPPGDSQRLGRRHAGISVIYFSVPVLLVFVLGQRVILHGGPGMIMTCNLLVMTYTISALLLLMLTSLSKLREYFRARRVRLPGPLTAFWVVLGLFMGLVVVFGATALPAPDLPPLAYVEQHEYDPWNPGSTFRLKEVEADEAALLLQHNAVQAIGRTVLILLAVTVGVFAAWTGVKWILGTLGPHWHSRGIAGKAVRGLQAVLARLGKLPSRMRPRRRVHRSVSRAIHYTSSLGREHGAAMAPADHVVYAYEALCALAEDVGAPRRKGQTPYEFIRSFPRELNRLKDEAVELTDLLVESQYAGREVDKRTLDRVRRFWTAFHAVRRRVVR